MGIDLGFRHCIVDEFSDLPFLFDAYVRAVLCPTLINSLSSLTLMVNLYSRPYSETQLHEINSSFLTQCKFINIG